MWDRSQVLSSQMAFERKMAFTRKMVVRRRASIDKQEEVGPCYLVHKNNGCLAERSRFIAEEELLLTILLTCQAIDLAAPSAWSTASALFIGSPFYVVEEASTSILAGKFDGDTTSSATESSQSPRCLLSKVATGLSFCTLKRKQAYCLVKGFRISISWLFDPLFKPLKVNIGFSNRRSWGESPSFLATGTGWWIALNGLMLLFSYCECIGKNCRWFKMVTQISFPRVCFRAAAELVLPLWHAWVTFSFIKWRGS